MEYLQPDASQRERDKVKRGMNDLWRESRPEDGLAKGVLQIAAEHLVEQIQDAYGLDGEEHKAAIIAYLVGCWGEIVHAFPDNPEFLPPYLQWREESVERVKKSLAEKEEAAEPEA